MKKRCNKCEIVKPITEFYKCRGMADGYLNQCKACKKVYADKYQSENIETLRKKARERMRHPDRIKVASELTKAWKAADERIRKCHNKVQTEIRAGRLTRKPCTKCGNEKSVAHHEDYDKPLEIVWLCSVCHKKRHKEILMEIKN